MPARVIAVGNPVNEAERTAIGRLRDELSDRFTLVHNFEVDRHGQRFEVDLAVIAPHAVYLVDLKGTRGAITARGGQWDPAGRAPYPSPLLKLRGNARALKGLIEGSDPGNRGLKSVYVDAAVVLTHPTAQFFDGDSGDGQDVVRLDKAAAFFRDDSRLPGWASGNIQPYVKRIENAVLGSARASAPRTRFGSWEVEEKLGETVYHTVEHLSGDDFAEYRAHNAATGADHVRLRVYPLDAYATEDKREAQRQRIANAYTALASLPAHPAIVGARDFFQDDAAGALVLVTDDVEAEALATLLGRRDPALTPERRLHVAADLLGGLAHAHAHGVTHRALSPAAVLVAPNGAATLTGFDVARPPMPREHTVAELAAARADERYQAPELYGEAGAATSASDVFAAGAVIYEALTGTPPFKSAQDVYDREGAFPGPPSAAGELPDGMDATAFDAWLQSLCAFQPTERPSAEEASAALARLLAPPPEPESPPDYRALPRDYALTPHLVVQEQLGQGGFATVYRVFYELADRDRVVKIVDRDRVSQLARLKQEFQRLIDLPPHPHVVRTWHADTLTDGTPYLLLDYVDGQDVRSLINARALSPADAWTLTTQVADALDHVHRHDVAHLDVKPSNILWTQDGARLIDFNVASSLTDGRHGGGQRRYLPPDVDLYAEATREVKVDRDVFALGCTLFEAVTGRFPYPEGAPHTEPLAPRSVPGLDDLSDEAADLLVKAVAPLRSRRFVSAAAFAAALRGVTRLRREKPATTTGTVVFRSRGDGSAQGNPFVAYLRTLYSQTASTNAGTRGLVEEAQGLYVETLLDRELVPAVLDGGLRLVVITGNAGDGKTAFLQRLERRAQEKGATRTPRPDGNGATLQLDGRTLLTNYDGSQDEGDRTNAQVLRDFLAPFEGDDPATWPSDRTHLIAINEGRLVDFLETEGDRYPALRPLVERGAGHEPTEGVAVVNLNLRSVTASAPDDERSIFRHLLERFTAPSLWAACDGCPLADRCYARQNAATFADPVAGPIVAGRLETLYRLTTLRGRLHVTLRDLGSALAYTLTSDRDCAEMQALYAEGDRGAILDGYYFNAWMGGRRGSADRLLSLLREADVGTGADPNLDRRLDFQRTGEAADLLGVEARADASGRDYVRELLDTEFDLLVRGVTPDEAARIADHRRFVAQRRRLAFFERRDDDWRRMLPFEAADTFLNILQVGDPTREGGPDEAQLATAQASILEAINRAEGLAEPEGLGGDLALQIRDVRDGTIRSYRVFPASDFRVAVIPDHQLPFLETEPAALELRYRGPQGQTAELRISLDLYELLDRLNRGYQPSPDDVQGRYLSLVVFKNLLSAAPYDELLLTRDGDRFYRVHRTDGGQIALEPAAAISA